MLRRTSLPLMLAMFGIAACGQDPAGPPAEGATSPTFSLDKGPAHSGVVWRYNNYHIQMWEFAETPTGEPWVLVLGLPEGDELMSCGGEGTSQPRLIHDVWQERKGDRDIVNEVRRHAAVQAYDARTFWDTWDANEPGGHCVALELDHFAEGVATQRWNDNDARAIMPHNAWGSITNGKLVYEGETYKIHRRDHYIWNEKTEVFSERVVAWIR